MAKDFITAHMVVKNEDRFIWYAISSILPYVDKIIVYDTGSIDNTIKIINSFTDKKIYFTKFNITRREEITNLRNEQIKLTNSDWIWIVDGDEIYTNELCKEILNLIKNKGRKIEGVVVGRYDLLGDIYHYQSESVGTYELFGRKGHMVLRLINLKNIPGLKVEGIYPNEGYYDKNGNPIITHSKNKYSFTKRKIYHAMYLKRSSTSGNLPNTFNRNKRKIEMGIPFSKDVLIPEVFDYPHPDYVDDVSYSRSLGYEQLAYLITPMKILKRKIWRLLISKK